MAQKNEAENKNCFTCEKIDFYYRNGIVSAKERELMIEQHHVQVSYTELDEAMDSFSFGITKLS